MKYMLLIYGAESCWTEEERESCMVESMQLCEELEAEGKYVASAPLHSVLTATSLKVRDGKRLITDGPFAETSEQLGGYYIIDVENLDEAIAVASRLPPAKLGTVEIRPIFDVESVQGDRNCDIISSRTLPFIREQVFEAIADPDRLARWWGPDGFTNSFEQFNFKPGGDWKFVMHGPDGKTYDNHNVFQSIVQPERIVLKHVSDPVFQMTMTLTAISQSKTKLHWRMTFESPQVRDRMAKICVDANEQNFDRLTAELNRPVPA